MTGLQCFDWPDRHSRDRPGEIAVATVDTGFQLTWAELEDRVGRLAHVLRDTFGVRHGDRVGLLGESDARYFEIQFACIRLGAIFVPLNIRLSVGELVSTLEDAGAVLLVHDATQVEAAAAIAARVGIASVRWDEGEGSTPYDAVRDLDAPHVAAQPLIADDIAQIMYTSGTTGKPKGVLCTNGAMAVNAVNMAHTSRCADRDAHAVNFVPLFHAGGLNIYCNPVLYWGGRVTTTRGFEPAQALSLLTDDKLAATITNGVLQMFERIADLPQFDDARFPTLRVTLFGGFGPSAPATHARWVGRGTVLQLGYGSTELGPMVCMNEDPDEQALLRGEFGRVVPYAELRCVDEKGAVLPAGATGEIQVRGPAVTAGYWGLDREGFSDDGWFSIGDVGYVDLGGFVHITGRLVERYRSGGENIYPAEVEAAFVDLPGVKELAVVGVPDPGWGEVGLIAVVPLPGVTITLDDVRRHAHGRLARFKLPRHLEVVDELPRSTTLKVARAEIRTRFVATHPTAAASAPAETGQNG
ncbi:MAG TPA: AMP-binding protein [Jatrophihabitantaceae bacterium]|nr:AMP-binding protein [Jatrophihabitantaceae bacterium]